MLRPRPRLPFVLLALAACSGTEPGSSGPSAVASVAPAAESVGAAPSADLVITLAGPIEASALGPRSLVVSGHWSGPVPGTVRLEASGTRIRFTPGRPFSAGEWVTASLSRDVAGPKGYAWGFWVRSAPASLALREVARWSTRRQGEGWIQSYGTFAGDMDGDGRPDLLIPNERTDDIRFMRNTGSGFAAPVVYPIPSGDVPSPNEGADFDGDGRLDFAVGNVGSDQVSVFLNPATGGLRHAANVRAGRSVRAVCVADLDGDGDPDIVTANRAGTSGEGNVSILRNDGGTFVSTALETGTDGETACAVLDANGDGLPDVAIGAYTSREMVLLLGDGAGGLVPGTPVPAGGRPWMIAAGDVNGDGHADVVSANAAENNVAVLLGDGRGGLAAPRTYPTGSFPVAVDLGDLDGDGDLEIVTSNYGGVSYSVYENQGAGSFGNRRTLSASSAGACAVLVDTDGDGVLEVIAVDELDDIVFRFDR